MRISDWSSDVCSSDLGRESGHVAVLIPDSFPQFVRTAPDGDAQEIEIGAAAMEDHKAAVAVGQRRGCPLAKPGGATPGHTVGHRRVGRGQLITFPSPHAGPSARTTTARSVAAAPD